MSADTVETLLKVLREKLLSPSVPDKATGQIILNLQSGGLGSVETAKIKL